LFTTAAEEEEEEERRRRRRRRKKETRIGRTGTRIRIGRRRRKIVSAVDAVDGDYCDFFLLASACFCLHWYSFPICGS
jgi:hypothetical protein